jgi:hypothetical protein
MRNSCCCPTVTSRLTAAVLGWGGGYLFRVSSKAVKYSRVYSAAVTWSYHTVLSGWWYTQCSQLMCGCTSLYTDGMLVLS